MAQYEHEQAFVVEEQAAESAAETMKKLRARFEGAAATQMGDEAFTVKAPYLDGVCVFRKGRFIAGYANVSDAAEAGAKAGTLLRRIP